MKGFSRILGFAIFCLIVVAVWVWFFSMPTFFLVGGWMTDYGLEAGGVETRGIFRYRLRDFAVKDKVYGHGIIFECDEADVDLGLQAWPLRLRLDARLAHPRYHLGALAHGTGLLGPEVRDLFMRDQAGIIFEEGKILALWGIGETELRFADFRRDEIRGGCDVRVRRGQMPELDAHIEGPAITLFSMFPRIIQPEDLDLKKARIGFHLRKGWLDVTKNDQLLLRARWKSMMGDR